MEDKIKKAYELVEKERKNKKEEQLNKVVKEFVQDILEKVEKLEEQIRDLEKQKKELKARLDDCKSGRLDLLEEKIRKVGEDKYKQITPFIIVQPVHIKEYPATQHWYEPHKIWYGDYQVTCTGNEFKQLTLGSYRLAHGTVDIR